MQTNGFFDVFTLLPCAQRASRLPALMQGQAIPVDTRALPELLVALRAYAENIKFYNLSNKVEGHWGALFFNHDALILSTAMFLQVDQWRERFLRERRRGLSAMLHELTGLIQRYEAWFEHAQALSSPLARQVGVRARVYVERHLGSTILNALVVLNSRMDAWPQLARLLEDALTDGTQADRDFSDISRMERDQFIQDTFEILLRGLAVLANDARKTFDELLTRQMHDPAVGLLLSFLKTYQQIQTKTNDFSHRLLNFYYQDVLNNVPEAGTGDGVILGCVLKPGHRVVEVPEGALFNAGKTADHQDLIYRAVKKTYLTGAELTALRTLYLQRHIDISPENVSQSVTRVKSYDLLGSDFSPPMSLFGYEKGARAQTRDDGSHIGLCIASDTLLLKEGQRDIQLDFYFRDDALTTFDSMKNRFKLLMATSEDAQSSEDVLNTLPSGSALLRRLRGSALLTHELVLFISLFQSLPGRLTAQDEIFDALQRFSSQPKPALINHWLNGGVSISAKLFKQCLLHLFRSISVMNVLGLVHFELMSRYLFATDFLDERERRQLLKRLSQLNPDSETDRMKRNDMQRDYSQSSFSALVRYFQNAFECHVSQPEGWQIHRNYSIAHTKARKNNSVAGGLSLTLKLGSDDPSVVPVEAKIHGPLPMPAKPVLILRVNRFSPRYPLSWFRPFSVEQAKLRVSVQNFRDVTLHNEYGQMDRTKPFMPFTAIPKFDARFYLGGYEYARKNVTSLTVKLNWNTLPGNFGGMGRYYAGYGAGYENTDFNVNITALSHGELLPKNSELQQQYSLFSWSATSQRLNARTRLNYQVSPAYPKIDRNLTRAEYENIGQLAHGYLCLRLKSGKHAFGHKRYTTLLSEALTWNAQHKRGKKKLPAEPYTPEIAPVEIDYCAEDTIEFVRDHSEVTCTPPASDSVSSLAFHISPLGLSVSQTGAVDRRNTLFPQVSDDGNLYIGYTPHRSTQHLCLYFQLGKDATQSVHAHRTDIRWWYFSTNGWRPLAGEQILSDSTQGLFHSGLVTLALPPDACEHPGYQPANQYWLCASCAEPRGFATLRGVSFDAIEVRSQDVQRNVCNWLGGLSSQWTAVKDIDGLQAVTQHEAAFGGMALETDREAVVRLQERLRHKNRTITPWDYERFILERFPNVELVKCLPNCRFNVHRPVPGHLLLVLAPAVTEAERSRETGHHLNAVKLRQIQQAVRELAPPSAGIDVINATYEYVQIRCAVQFTSTEYIGEQRRRLQRDLSNFISPWSPTGLAGQFSWSIRIKELEAYVRALSYIRAVARVSLVKCYGDHHTPEYFRLQDTAKATQNSLSRLAITEGQQRLQSSYPWSLPLPSRSHFIELLKEGDDDYFAQPVGINSLEIGNTFVIQSRRHAEAE